MKVLKKNINSKEKAKNIEDELVCQIKHCEGPWKKMMLDLVNYVIVIIHDALEPELEEFEEAELEEQLLQPPAAPTYVPSGRQSTRPGPRKKTAEEDELAELQAEMEL
nr:ATP-dependent DNA helicase PIF1-like [Tanacetum cinerariifolium]